MVPAHPARRRFGRHSRWFVRGRATARHTAGMDLDRFARHSMRLPESGSPPLERVAPAQHRSAKSAPGRDDEQAGGILRAARDDAARRGLGFAGSLSVTQASAVFRTGGTRLIDVRADSELDLEGFVPGSIHIPWALPPAFGINPAFIPELALRASKHDVLLFHCRRGSRSAAAAQAATEAGFRRAFSIDGGIDEMLAAFTGS